MWIRLLNRYLAKIHIYPQDWYTLQRKHHFPWTLQMDLRKNNICNIKYQLLLQQLFLSLDLKCFGNISAWKCNNLDLSLHLVLSHYFRRTYPLQNIRGETHYVSKPSYQAEDLQLQTILKTNSWTCIFQRFCPDFKNTFLKILNWFHEGHIRKFANTFNQNKWVKWVEYIGNYVFS